MVALCNDNREAGCRSYPNCYGCRAFVNPTNFDRIKHMISEMSMKEFIDFCGGDSCENILCKGIDSAYAYCSNGKGLKCGECIREYLKGADDNYDGDEYKER
jgi:hypothetical protein